MKSLKRYYGLYNYVRRLPNIERDKLAVFLSVCDDISTEQSKPIVRAAGTKAPGNDDRIALHALQLAKIVEAIISARKTLTPEDYQRIADDAQQRHGSDGDSALNGIVAATINGFLLSPTAVTYRVYIENRGLAAIERASVDLPLPGNLTAKAHEHEKSDVKRLPNFVRVGPGLHIKPVRFGYLPFLQEGNQDFCVFQSQDIDGMWTNDISYCVAVALLYGALPEYTAMTFAHLPAGNIHKIDWPAMFFEHLPGGLRLDFGRPSRAVVVYHPPALDSHTLACLPLLEQKIPRQNILVYGFHPSSTSGAGGCCFGINKYGYFGIVSERPGGEAYPSYLSESGPMEDLRIRVRARRGFV